MHDPEIRSSLSIVLPVFNEEKSLRRVLDQLREHFPDAEVIVVDDGSNDGSATVGKEAGARVISHPYNLGNGAAIKTGARAATGAILVTMDADGQHDPAIIPKLLAKLAEGHDMVVGARRAGSQASVARLFGNSFYNRFASWVVGHRIEDLTSGLRAVRTEKFREFLTLLPNGFSYPTTITMAFFRAGYSVAYVPFDAARREGKSHLRIVRDGVRFLLIIFRVGTLYSPLKIFTPISLFFFLLGFGYYLYTFATMSRFTNMSALLLVTSVLVFLIGLVSEQITTLVFSTAGRDARR